MAAWREEQLKRVLAMYAGAGDDGVLRGEVSCGIGRAQTPVPRVRLFWSTVSTARATSVVDAGVVLLLSGTKTGHVGAQRLAYDADRYLVVSASIPYEYSAQASPEVPVVGLFVELDLAELSELVQTLGPHERADADVPGLRAVPMDAGMRDAVRRVLDAMVRPQDAAVLGAALVREVVYRALIGPGGPALRSLTRRDCREARLARLILNVKRDVAAPWSVEALARAASMSVTSFHRAFKGFVGESPLQYIKKVRLHKASGLLVYDGLSVKEASARVGYASPTQFSREFKRLFGRSPSALRRLGAMPPQAPPLGS